MLNRLLRLQLLLVSLLAAVSCGDTEYEYCIDYHCNFAFNMSTHNTSVLNSCVSQTTSNTFCMVWSTKNPMRHVHVQMYGGKEEVNDITADLELRQSTYELGAGNGLVMGRSSFNNGQLYAFDRQCPNCLDNMRYRPLQWESNGMKLHCGYCNRSYDLINGGRVSSGESGKKLLRYKAYITPTATGDMLIVRN